MRVLQARYLIGIDAYVSGADQTSAELRPASLKGLLRFWWRAAAWNRLAGDLERIHAAEQELFGSTKGQARFLLSLEGEPDTSESPSWRAGSWQQYIGYGLREDRPRKHLTRGSEFTLNFMFRHDRTNPNETDRHFHEIAEACQLLGLFGGMGGRSRKGWGSLTLIGLQEHTSGAIDELHADTRTLDSYMSFCHQVLEQFSKVPLPAYTAFSRDSKFVAGPVQRSADRALEYLARTYRDAIRDPEAPGSVRADFGLPRDNIGRPNLEKRRRASPVFLHVHKLVEGFLPVALFLPAAFLDDHPEPPAHWSQIHEFLDRMATGNE